MIGQAHVTEPLMTALRTGRVGHAYLFSGPRGCGKTTSARILARCLNCAEGPTDTPCGVCPSCVELSRDGGGSLDVVEIDAASHGGVDDARELRERAVFAPARDRYKIFIIDEAHMVTSGGFNALLKIVEEPPPHVKFIFATTEPEKVIGTIRSRTHHYPFRLIAPGTLIDYVQQLCDSEGVQVEPGVLPLVVRSGGGSVRDTLSILDQLIAGSEGASVSLARATGLLGFTSAELIDETVAALGAGDSAAAFGATDRVVQTGQDPRRFVEDLLERLRDLIVISATSMQGASAVFRGVPEDRLQRMFEQSQTFAPGQLSRIADTISATLDTMVGATAPRLHLELMVARALLVTGQSQSSSAGSARAAQSSAPNAAVSSSSPGAVAQFSSTPASAARPAAEPSRVERSATPGPAQSPGAGSASPPAVDVIAAMRSARDFLNSDNSGTGRPPIVPLGGRAPEPVSTGHADASAPADESLPETARAAEVPAAGPEAAAAPEAAEAHATTQSQPERAAEALGLEDLLEVWPDLLEELLENDREAWNAVKQAQPLGLEGQVLTVGLASRADLDAFKASGAGPLREAIAGALGFTVKYMPKPLPAAAVPMAAERESAAQPTQEPSPRHEPEREAEPARSSAEPAVAGPSAGEPSRDAAPEPPTPAEPAYAGPSPVEQELARTDPVEPEPDYGPPPELDYQQALEPAQAEAPAPEAAAPEPQRAEKKAASPGFTRYGEAVVREVLGARFLEEKPLPPGFEK